MALPEKEHGLDGKRFDDLARFFATRTDRRRFLRRGVLAAAAAGGLMQASRADAARRGKPPTTTICNPDGAGGYTRITIDNILLPAYLAAGALRDNGCCAGIDCGESGDACEQAVCNPATGACESLWLADDTECTPAGPLNLCRTPYTCQSGVCSEGTGVTCAHMTGCIQSIGCNPATGLCETAPREDGTSCFRESGCVNGVCIGGVCLDPPPIQCFSDACRICSYSACTGGCVCINVGCERTDCHSGSCDPAVGCVFTNINEGLPCDLGGDTGICEAGACVLVN